MDKERGVGVYCEAKGFEERYKIEKDVAISSAELEAIEIATNFIFQQDEQRAVKFTDTRTAFQLLMKAIEGDRHNKIAMRIQHTCVGLEGNERADILAKDGVVQKWHAYRLLPKT
jgi:hypothetical protein